MMFVLLWSSGYIGAKLAGPDVPITTVLMWRFVVVVVILATGIAAVAGRNPLQFRRTRGWRRQILIGLLAQCGYTLLLYQAIALGVSTGTTALIAGLQPLAVAALAGSVLGVATSIRQWWGLGAGAVGVVIVTWTDATSSVGHTPLWAYLLPVISMACLVAGTFIDRRSGDTMSPALTLAVQCATSAMVFSVVCLITGTAVPPMNPHFWLAIAWLVGFSTLGGYGLYWVLIRRSGVTSVNTLMFLMPPVTALWGALMYGEAFTWTTGLGLALALGATWVVSRAPRRTAPCADDAVRLRRDQTRRRADAGSSSASTPRRAAHR